MRLRTFAVFLWGCLIASAAIAGDKHRTEIKIEVDGDDNGHRVFKFDSQDSGIDLQALEVGESRSYTDDDGNEVTVTRNEKGYEFDVAGEKIEIVDVDSDDHDLKILHRAHGDSDIVVEKHHKVHVIKTEEDVGVTIISGDEIDAETRARIELVLKEAGKEGEVMFIDGSELSGDEQAQRKVRVIKQEIDVTN